jgi:hypothetical protein
MLEDVLVIAASGYSGFLYLSSVGSGVITGTEGVGLGAGRATVVTEQAVINVSKQATNRYFMVSSLSVFIVQKTL